MNIESRIKALASEHFDDYVIIYRTRDNHLCWSSSNTSFALGATEQVNLLMKKSLLDHRHGC